MAWALEGLRARGDNRAKEACVQVAPVYLRTRPTCHDYLARLRNWPTTSYYIYLPTYLPHEAAVTPPLEYSTMGAVTRCRRVSHVKST